MTTPISGSLLFGAADGLAIGKALKGKKTMICPQPPRVTLTFENAFGGFLRSTELLRKPSDAARRFNRTFACTSLE